MAAGVVLARALVLESVQHSAQAMDCVSCIDLVRVSPELRFYSGYDDSQLYACEQRMAKLLLKSGTTKFLVNRSFFVLVHPSYPVSVP